MFAQFLKKIWFQILYTQQRYNKKIRQIFTQFKIWKSLAENSKKIRELRKSHNPDQKVTAIFLTEHFGDIVACEPIIRKLHNENSNNLLVWFTYPPYVEILKNHPLLNKALPVKCLAECDLIKKSGMIDQIVDLHIGPRACKWTGNFYYQSDKATHGINVYNHYFHGTILEALSLAAGLGVPSEQPQIHIPDSIKDEVGHLIPRKPYVVIHAASNMPARDWDNQKWKQLVGNILREYDVDIVEVGLESRVGNLVPKVYDLCGKLSLLQLAEVIRRSVGFVGIDSGPAHFANATLRPSVILLGHYLDYKKYMPYTGFLRDNSEEMIVFWDGPAKEIPVEVIETKIKNLLLKSLQSDLHYHDASSSGISR
jgi:heptosyltransferase-3